MTISARKGVVTIRSGKGDAYREVALNALVRAVIEEWTTERTGCATDGEPALFVSAKGTRISLRAADTAIRRVGAGADLALSVRSSAAITAGANCARWGVAANAARRGRDRRAWTPRWSD